jgi:hypothetical protein
MICTNAIVMAKGLAVLWNPRFVLMEIFFTTRWSISMEYRIIGSNKHGFLTNVYVSASPRDMKTFIHNLEGLVDPGGYWWSPTYST